jgi:hypothetical protein
VPLSRLACCLLGLIGMLAACETLGPPEPLPAGAEPFAAPSDFGIWWARTEACSGRSGDMSGIEWYVVPGAHTVETSLGPKVGVWSHSAAGMRIVLAGDYVGSELVVRHEMLHALLDREGHPSEYFVARCQLTWESWQGAD